MKNFSNIRKKEVEEIKKILGINAFNLKISQDKTIVMPSLNESIIISNLQFKELMDNNYSVKYNNGKIIITHD